MKKENLKMIRVLYNPLANNKNGKAEAEKLKDEDYQKQIAFSIFAAVNEYTSKGK